MTVTNTTYCTTEELSAYVGRTTTNDVQLLNWSVTTTARWIDDYCGRSFSNDDTASPRVFKPLSTGTVLVDDFHTTDGLIVAVDDGDNGTYGSTWTAADYQLEPLNGVVRGVSGFPYWRIRAVERCFPVCNRRASVQVTAKWGWAAVPDAVKHAALILGQEFMRLKDAPFGVAGVDAFGPIRVRDNNRVTSLLAPYVKDSNAVLVA